MWQVPADSTAFSVASFLPPSVAMVGTGTDRAFELSLPGVTVARTLGQLCPSCAQADGMRAAKPEFTLADSTTVFLPTDVASADVVGGAIDYTVDNGFSFDPLNPGASAGARRGWFTVRISNGSALIATDSVAGADLALTAGQTRSRSIAFLATPGAPVRVAGPLNVVVTMHSPAGDEVTINTAERFSVTAVARGFRVSRASIAVAARRVSGLQDTLDLSGLGTSVSDRVQGGAILFTVRNPFAIQGALTVRLTAPGGATIEKSIALPLGGDGKPVVLRIALSHAELRPLLGSTNVSVGVSGSVSAPDGPVTVTPSQVLSIASTLEVILSSAGH